MLKNEFGFVIRGKRSLKHPLLSLILEIGKVITDVQKATYLSMSVWDIFRDVFIDVLLDILQSIPIGKLY